VQGNRRNKNLNRGQGPPNRNQGGLAQLRRMGCGSWGIWLIILAAIAIAAFSFLGTGGNATQISYTTFHQQLASGNVASVTVNSQKITGKLKKEATKQTSGGNNVQYTNFVTYIPSFGDNQLLTLMQQQGVEVTVQPPSSGVSWLSILLYLAPTLLLLGLGWWFLRRMRSQGQNIMSGFGMRDSGAKLYERSKQRTTFDDVAGLKGPKAELEEIIEFLRRPQYFQRLGGEVPRGVLLIGPPGTGKTLLARAVAGEADVPFLSITGSNFMEMLVGVGASRVRDLFKEAKKSSPSIIFIDEIDSIGRRRGAGIGGGHDEREQTLNQLLNELDGFEPNEGVIVMAATNRPDILDPALMRPGRFDRRISVDLPTMVDRLEILKIHGRNKPLAEDVELEDIARGTPGFSGADLENLLNEAALLAARAGKDAIEGEDVEKARDKVIMGLERENLALSDEELKLLAYHEGGHAVVAAILPNADPIHKVTIVPRGRAMGVTQQLPERDKYVYRREYMLDRLAVMMGGRAAENIVMKTATSGSENDLKQATQLARKMVLDWGMSERLGHTALGTRGDNVFLGQEIAQRRDYSETTAREIDEEVQTILDEAYQEATDTLQEHRQQLDNLAERLIEKEEIDGQEVLNLLGIDREPDLVSFGSDGRDGRHGRD
jgi:cell division protease FtsH